MGTAADAGKWRAEEVTQRIWRRWPAPALRVQSDESWRGSAHQRCASLVPDTAYLLRFHRENGTRIDISYRRELTMQHTK